MTASWALMSIRFSISFLVLLSLLAPVSPAGAEEVCRSGFRVVTCIKTADGAKELLSGSESNGLEFRLAALCAPESVCGREGCVVDGKPGAWYELWSRPVGSAAWDRRGEFCIPFTRNLEFGIVGPEDAWREVRRMEWPAATLSIQPPNGRTLVNLETNFFTMDTGKHTARFRLVGKLVEVEVHPVGYVWHAGDGTSWETEGPGSAYPDLDVTHVYTSTGSYEPSVDIVYSGRFRVDGDEWHDFPDTHTVEGESESLEVVQARPELVKPGS